MKGLVNKPQFDTSVFTPGRAIRVESRDRNKFYGFNNNCLVVKATPLNMDVAYVKDENNKEIPPHIDYETIPVDLVASGVVTITLMIQAVEAEKEEHA